MTDGTPNPLHRERPQRPVRPSRAVSSDSATGTADGAVNPARTLPVAPERQFATRREMRMAQRAAEASRNDVPARKPVPLAVPVGAAEEVVVPEAKMVEESQSVESGVVPAGGDVPVVFDGDMNPSFERGEVVFLADDAESAVSDDTEEDERELLEREIEAEQEAVTLATGIPPVVVSEEELKYKAVARMFVRRVAGDDEVLDLVGESDTDTLDEHLRSLMYSFVNVTK